MQSVQPARHILVVDDDAGLREEISGYLQDHGYALHVASDARSMETVLAEAPIDLMILDLMLPGEDGLSICRRIAAGRGPAIVMMSAMGDEVDRVLGLELGADDYLTKPCSPRELLARVRAVMRRLDDAREGRAGPPGRAKIYEFLGFTVDAYRRQVRTPSGIAVLLTAGEFTLLQTFLDNPQRILTRDQLLEHTRGGEPDVFGRAVDVQISRLRRKLHADIDREVIRTLRGAGYMLDAKVSRA